MSDKVLTHLAEMEAAAEAILFDKQEIVDLDKKRNLNREAMRGISASDEAATSATSKTWLAMGNCFFQLPTEKAKGLLEKGE